MDGIHDLGGLTDFGPVPHAPDEPVFHADWERRVWGLTNAVGMRGHLGGTPSFRHALERMEASHYLAATYYERWLTGITTLLAEQGLIEVDELEERAGGRFPLSLPSRAGATDPGTDVTEPRYTVGDRVRVIDTHPLGHTRCPGYVRGKVGEVIRHDGAFPFPDIEAHGGTVVRDPAYGVRFAHAELWGDDGRGDVVHVDLSERYLEPA